MANMSQSEKKRLFLGGLYSEIREQDISERFKSFGSVSSVEIHRKDAQQGFPGKTFAYIDICASEASVKKCISVFTNTNWKGSQIKVQLAKESFLARLEKERQGIEVPKKSRKVPSIPSSLPKELIDPIKNAVPGTLIPGKDNWVVGKFGRALPVVKMRPKGSRRIYQFDPSKTVHNLKRIKDEDMETSFDQLTWEIEGESKTPGAGACKSGKNKEKRKTKDSMSPESEKKRAHANGESVETLKRKRKIQKEPKEKVHKETVTNLGLKEKEITESNNKIDSISPSPKKKNKSIKNISEESSTSFPSRNNSSLLLSFLTKDAEEESIESLQEDSSDSDEITESDTKIDPVSSSSKKKSKSIKNITEESSTSFPSRNNSSFLLSFLTKDVDEESVESIQEDSSDSDEITESDTKIDPVSSSSKKKSKSIKNIAEESSTYSPSRNNSSFLLSFLTKDVDEESVESLQDTSDTEENFIDDINDSKLDKGSLLLGKNKRGSIEMEEEQSEEQTTKERKKKNKKNVKEVEEKHVAVVETEQEDVTVLETREEVNEKTTEKRQKKHKEKKEKALTELETEQEDTTVLEMREETNEKTTEKQQKKSKKKVKKEQRIMELETEQGDETTDESEEFEKDAGKIMKTKKRHMDEVEDSTNDSAKKTNKEVNGCGNDLIESFANEKKQECTASENISSHSKRNGDKIEVTNIIDNESTELSHNRNTSELIDKDDERDINQNLGSPAEKKKKKRKHRENDNIKNEINAKTQEKDVEKHSVTEQINNNKKKSKKHNSEPSSVVVSSELNQESEKRIKKKKTKKEKKIDSNERRIDAIKDREKAAISQKMLIASALKNIDSGGKSNEQATNHIVFDSDVEEGEMNDLPQEKRSKESEGKISGSQASNWLGFDSRNDSDDDDVTSGEDEDDVTFAPKPQFEGKSGEKLFKLQKSFRGDSRFQLDQRFVESDDEDNEEEEEREKIDDRVDVGDDVTQQLAKERDMSMSVLRNLLGGNLGSRLENQTMEKEIFRDSAFMRYDPARENHAEFEQEAKKEPSPEPAVTQKTKSMVDQESSAPEVTKETYYDVNAVSLADVFGAKKIEVEATSSFTFLTEDTDEADSTNAPPEVGEVEILRSVPWNPVKLPYDSSGDEDEEGGQGDMEEEAAEAEGTTPEPPPVHDELFFFHPGDSELENRLDGESAFMRKGSLDEIHDRWVRMRSELTQDYKKKHKDALRRKSKMAVIKRTRLR